MLHVSFMLLSSLLLDKLPSRLSAGLKIQLPNTDGPIIIDIYYNYN